MTPRHFTLQDPAGIFELIEVVGNGTYGQVYKVKDELLLFLGLLVSFSVSYFSGAALLEDACVQFIILVNRICIC